MPSQEEIIIETARLSDVNDGYTIATSVIGAFIKAGEIKLTPDFAVDFAELARGITKEISRDRASKIGRKAPAGVVPDSPAPRGA